MWRELDFASVINLVGPNEEDVYSYLDRINGQDAYVYHWENRYKIAIVINTNEDDSISLPTFYVEITEEDVDKLLEQVRKKCPKKFSYSKVSKLLEEHNYQLDKVLEALA